MKKNNSRLTFGIIEIVSLIVEKKYKILFTALSIFVVLSLIFHFINEKKIRGTITVFPVNETTIINDLNEYTKLVNEKKSSLIGFIKEEEVIAASAIKNISSNYFSPTSLVWIFSDSLEKKLLKYPGISQIRVYAKDHEYYQDHLSFLTLTFDINEKFIDSIYQDVNKFFLETSIEIKKNLTETHSENSKNIKFLIKNENDKVIKKIEDLEKILLKSPPLDLLVNSNANITASFYERDLVEEKFQIINYCLKERNVKILQDCTILINKSLKKNLKIISDDLVKLGKKLNDTDFSTIKSLNDDIIEITEQDSNFLYLALLITSFVISLVLVTLTELIKKKKIKIT